MDTTATRAEQRELDKLFYALSDSTRREILLILSTGEHCAGDITARFDQARPAISRHLVLATLGK